MVKLNDSIGFSLIITLLHQFQFVIGSSDNTESVESRGKGHVNRIVGGDEVNSAFKYPWMASLQWKGSHVCGGTLISRDTIITAAHCSVGDTKEFSVILHRHNLSLPITKEDGESFQVIDRYVHEGYAKETNYNDIALWKLSGSYKGELEPIKLDDGNATKSGDVDVTGIGWGKVRADGPLSSVLMQVTLPVMTMESCVTVMQEHEYKISPDSQICAGTPKGGKDTCQGDSGGPLIALVDNHPTLVGITSFGISCALPGLPGIYTRISHFLPWLKQHLTTTTPSPSPSPAPSPSTAPSSSPSKFDSPLPHRLNHTRSVTSRNIPIPIINSSSSSSNSNDDDNETKLEASDDDTHNKINTTTSNTKEEEEDDEDKEDGAKSTNTDRKFDRSAKDDEDDEDE